MTQPHGKWDVQLETELAVATWTPDEYGIGYDDLMLEFSIDECAELGQQLTEAARNAAGVEKLLTVARDLEEGDYIPGLNITVDYALLIGVHDEIGVWADGACVLTFRDPDHRITVERKIS